MAHSADSKIKAVLGPTNTGKTHLAIERLCAHSSGMIGFPLRLLAREVYDRVCAIKGAANVGLVTGEERIVPPGARWLLCTTEAMPMGADMAFVGLDEAQLAADRERGHIFTDRLLNARGREETMILGSSSLAPLLKKLMPEAEITSRPRFSALCHSGAAKLSRVPPRSAIVAFSSEQVYAVAEMLRRFRGGAAVVMGALSPETRNKQVAMYQAGEVDYLVATDAIGMGLNLDIGHVAFAGLGKFDGQRHRRLTPAEMAQIAGRAGRHQRDGTFGSLANTGHDATFDEQEIYAIEEHKFPPLTRLFWRDPEPRLASLAQLIADLEAPPSRAELVKPPEAIDLRVLNLLAGDTAIADSITDSATLSRFWDLCRLPDFRQQGAETHARFIARLWSEMQDKPLPSQLAASAIAHLDNAQGDIDSLQARIAAIRIWAYIAQRPDWLAGAAEMGARAREAEQHLSDALHQRLQERFINRRTAVLMRGVAADSSLLSVQLVGERVLVEDQEIGTLVGFHFQVHPETRLQDRKMLLAAAERHMPGLLQVRAEALTADITDALADIDIVGGKMVHAGIGLAKLAKGRALLQPKIVPDSRLSAMPASARNALIAALQVWLDSKIETIKPLQRLQLASNSATSGPELRALLIRLIENAGMTPRLGSGLDRLDQPARLALRQMGVRIGALDLFVPAMLRPDRLNLWQQLAEIFGLTRPAPLANMPPVVSLGQTPLLLGYRTLNKQALRIDMAEKLLHAAHARRAHAPTGRFSINPAQAISMGLTTISFAHLLRQANFAPIMPRTLADGQHGAPAPLLWQWRPQRRKQPPKPALRENGAFAALAELAL